MAKHETVCLKHASKKRKIFDSSKQRTEGIPRPLQKSVQGSAAAEREYKLAQIQERKNQWRKKHEEFINAIRAAKEYTNAKKTGAPLPPPPPPTVNPDLIQCKYCLRRFNEKAAERHIKFCESQHNRLSAPTTKKGRGGTSRSTKIPGRSGDEGMRSGGNTLTTVSPLQQHQPTTPQQPSSSSAIRKTSQSGIRAAMTTNKPRVSPQPTAYESEINQNPN
ncbi:unnamed protein product [Echinostoma caproni]|uniref:C2HC/C3H-type domain-containing protein n=1 Tax=Echinostoma caproni TaxID=27848 RepID=A0A3P8K9D5_9TREM|nr:unnamed protein product [Echinostoma caproni]